MDIDKVTAFAASQHLTLVESHAARRTVVLEGTAAQMSAAFAVELGHYEHTVMRGRNAQPQKETYRGRDGFVHIPPELQGIVLGVLGLDNRKIDGRNGGRAAEYH